MSIALGAGELAQVTRGQWSGLDNDTLRFEDVAMLANAGRGTLCIIVDQSKKWKKAGVSPPPLEKISQAIEKGVTAFVVGPDFQHKLPCPLLKVDNTWEALEQIATANRDKTTARRILVTGSVGKTNYKLMAHHAFSPLIKFHANLSSANLNVPIWCSLASMAKDDEMSVIEVSVANPNRGRQRSAFIQPHIVVFTNISASHTSYHGSVENLIHAKAESVLSLQAGGVVLMGSDHPYFLALKHEVQRLKPVPVMTWGREEYCDAQLLSADYDLQQGCWRVRARVMGEQIDYTIGTHHSFAPMSSLGVLLTAAVSDLDVKQVAQQLASYLPGETTGRIYAVQMSAEKTDNASSAHFTLFDYSQRGSIEGFRAALTDLYRLAPEHSRIILALGESRDLSAEDEKAVHEEIAQLIQLQRTAKIFTVGEGMKILRQYLQQKMADRGMPADLLAEHQNTQQALTPHLLAAIRAGDIVFIQGHHRVWMSRIVKAMRSKWQFRQLGATPQSAQPPAKDKTWRFMAVGDMILSRDFPGRLIEEGSAWVFGNLEQSFQQADAFLANLECVISQKGDYMPKIREKRPFHFRAPQFVVEVLKRGNISVLCTANNHSMDYGAEALLDQMKLFEQMHMPFAGSGKNLADSKRWVLQQCGDVKVALIAFDTTAPWARATDERAGNFYLPCDVAAMAELLPLIEQAKQYAHIVMVTVHWGANWKEKPTPKTVAFAHAMIDAGVDAVLGHSSHLLQGVECYRGKPIIYDMGTIISDRVNQGRIKDEAFFELRLSQYGIHELIITPIFLYRCRARRSRNSLRRILDLMRRLSADLNTRLVEKEGQLVLPLTIDKHPRSVQQVTGEETVRLGNKDKIQYPQAAQVQQLQAPALQAAGRILSLGHGLEVGGYLHPQKIAPGYAFVFEIRFRCRQKLEQRWRAEICFEHESGEQTRLRYPVADGSWHHVYSGSDQWYADRTLVRTPQDLAQGKYRLYWNFWTRDEEKQLFYWQQFYDDAVHMSKGVAVGELQIDANAEQGVAGVEWDTELTFRDPEIQ